MTRRIEFSIEIPPRAKGRPRFGKGGHAFTPAVTRAYEEAFREQARCNFPRVPLDKPVRIDLRFHFKGKRRGDLDNYIKAVTDSMNGHAYVDDRLIFEIHALARDGFVVDSVYVLVEEVA